MPLNVALLKNNILKITGVDTQIHEGFPASTSEAAIRWAEAINEYGSQVIPASVTSVAATTALQAHLNTVPALGMEAFKNGIIAYATTLASGMAPAFAGTPSITILNLDPAFDLGFSGASSTEVAELMSNIIDVWFRTGTAINSSTGSTINWN